MFLISCLFVFVIATIMQRINGNEGVEITCSIFTMQARKRLMRLIKPHKTFVQKSFAFLGYRFYNLLPTKLKRIV